MARTLSAITKRQIKQRLDGRMLKKINCQAARQAALCHLLFMEEGILKIRKVNISRRQKTLTEAITWKPKKKNTSEYH